MCGRYQLTATGEELAEAFGLVDPPALPDRYNIAPGQDVAVVRVDARARRQVALLRWGLVPRFAREAGQGPRSINARAETVTTRGAFRESFRQRRCLLPARGFYEWVRRGGRRQPYLIRRPDGQLFAFAGLWDEWRGPEGAPLQTCTIVTTAASPVVAPIHDRMPVILRPESIARWLDPGEGDLAALQALLVPDPELVAIPVSSRVNSVAHDDPACAQPVEEIPAPRVPAQQRLF